MVKLLKVDTVEEAANKLRESFKNMPWRSLEVSLKQAAGMYLSEDIYADENLPGFNRAVVDGYAIKSEETTGIGETSPLFLTLAGNVEMGKAWEELLANNSAVYVPTGGSVPKGATGVVMVEHTEKLDEKTIALNRSVAYFEGIMREDEDLKKASLIFKKGHRLRTVDMGILAAMGRMMVPVFDKPIVSVISTGDEIVSIAEDPQPGKVRDVNSFSMAAHILESGCKLGDVYLIKDDYEKLKEAMEKALGRSDLVLVSGGSSQGSKDYTAQAIDSLGQPGIISHGLALKPGKPTILGIIQDVNCSCCIRRSLIAGLPGHPVAAMGVYNILIEPFIKETFFANHEKPIRVKGILAENTAAGEGRETIVTVSLEETNEGYLVHPVHSKSGAVSQLLKGDGYIIISGTKEGLLEGSLVDVYLFK